MRQPILLFISGIFSSALLISAISVYILHDVDRDQIGHWNEAFAGLAQESILFALFIGAAVALLTALARKFLKLTRSSPRPVLGAVLGMCIPLIQYPWDYAVRKELPALAQLSLICYLVFATAICTALLVRDNFKQQELHRDEVSSF